MLFEYLFIVESFETRIKKQFISNSNNNNVLNFEILEIK